MSTNYQSYIDYLASFADSNSLAVHAETNIYPLFVDIKNLINHYSSTIRKFSNIQNELINFIDRLEFDEQDFEYYQNKFLELRKIDGYLQELKTKQVTTTIAQQVQDFISQTYDSASLFNLEKLEEQVLSKINLTYEVQRPQETSGCLGVLLFIIVIVILGFTIIY